MTTAFSGLPIQPVKCIAADVNDGDAGLTKIVPGLAIDANSGLHPSDIWSPSPIRRFSGAGAHDGLAAASQVSLHRRNFIEY
jgi:hypothetical protein